MFVICGSFSFFFVAFFILEEFFPLWSVAGWILLLDSWKTAAAAGRSINKACGNLLCANNHPITYHSHIIFLLYCAYMLTPPSSIPLLPLLSSTLSCVFFVSLSSFSLLCNILQYIYIYIYIYIYNYSHYTSGSITYRGSRGGQDG